MPETTTIVVTDLKEGMTVTIVPPDGSPETRSWPDSSDPHADELADLILGAIGYSLKAIDESKARALEASAPKPQAATPPPVAQPPAQAPDESRIVAKTLRHVADVLSQAICHADGVDVSLDDAVNKLRQRATKLETP